MNEVQTPFLPSGCATPQGALESIHACMCKYLYVHVQAYCAWLFWRNVSRYLYVRAIHVSRYLCVHASTSWPSSRYPSCRQAEEQVQLVRLLQQNTTFPQNLIPPHIHVPTHTWINISIHDNSLHCQATSRIPYHPNTPTHPHPHPHPHIHVPTYTCPHIRASTYQFTITHCAVRCLLALHTPRSPRDQLAWLSCLELV